MLTINFPHSKLKSRPLSALIRYLSDKYIEKVVLTGNFIFFAEKQVNILKNAALLEHALVEDNYMFSYKDVFNKEQSFSKEDLLTFASNVKQQSLTINYCKRVKTNKLTEERLQFIYIDCVSKLYKLGNFKDTAWYVGHENAARKVNHYRQLLANNGYLTGPDNSIYLNPDMSVKELAGLVQHTIDLNKLAPWYKVKQIVNPNKSSLVTIFDEKIPQITKTAKASKYKMTIIDCDTGNVVHEVYLPKEI